MKGLVIVVRKEAAILIRDGMSWRLPVSRGEAGLDDECKVEEKDGSLFWDGRLSSFNTPFANLWGQGRIDLFTKKSIVNEDAIPGEVKKILLVVLEG